ncbi:MAG: hypothetical protein IKE91_08595 [Clostridia bacterium]|nr:hypothetical protein [Clostridia bacterium]
MIRNFWININEKYQRNKAVIWFVLIVIIFVVLVTKNLEKIINSARGSSVSTTSGSVSNDDEIARIARDSNDNYNEVSEKLNGMNITKEDRIKLFVQLCNNGKVEAAYECLSDACKETLYPTKESFVDAYYSAIFKISKDCDITEVKNGTYRVKYVNDKLSTGGAVATEGEIIDYISFDYDNKINISGLIRREENNITSIAPIFTVYIDKTQIFMDYVVCEIRVKNNTMADIYINDADNSNLYINDEDGNAYSINTDGMFDVNYYVPARSEKSIKLKFDIKYAQHSSIKEMVFGNMIIKNKEFLDVNNEITNPTTGEVEYAKVKTNFPEKYTWTVKFE